MIAVLFREHSIELVGRRARDSAVKHLDNRSTTAAMRMNQKSRVRFVKRGMESCPPRR
jgi:hypothetical protein